MEETPKNKPPKKPAAKPELLLSSDGKVAGKLTVGGVWTKSVQGTKHFLRNPPAIALDADVYDRLTAAGTLKWFRVTDTQTSKIYTITAEDFAAHKGNIDRGYGRQYFCRISHFTSREPQTTIPVPEPGTMPDKKAMVAKLRDDMKKRGEYDTDAAKPSAKPEQFVLGI